MFPLIILLLVFAARSGKFTGGDLSGQAALQESTASDECFPVVDKNSIFTKESFLLQLGHGHHAPPKRDKASEATKFASHVVPSTERSEYAPSGIKATSRRDQANAVLPRADRIWRWISKGRRSSSDADRPRMKEDPSRTNQQKELHEAHLAFGTRYRSVGAGIRAFDTSGFTALCALAVHRIQVLQVSYPVYALLGILVVMIAAVVCVVLVAFQSDGPRQELPPSQESRPHPRLLGRMDPSPRQIPARKDSVRLQSDRGVARSPGTARSPATPQTNASFAAPSSSATLRQLSGAYRGREASFHSADDRERPSTSEPRLCPRLVVPEGMELVFKVPGLIDCERQDQSFCIEDLDGNAMSHVQVDEKSFSSRCGIYLQFLDRSPVASVNTRPFHGEHLRELPHICTADGVVFCSLLRVGGGDDSGCQYVLRSAVGEDLYAFKGSFSTKAISAVHASGRLACITRRCKVDTGSRYEAYYEVRVGAGIDAGLMLCGLMAIDKVEGMCATL